MDEDNKIDFVDLTDEHVEDLVHNYAHDVEVAREYAQRLLKAKPPDTVPQSILGVSRFVSALIRALGNKPTDANEMEDVTAEVLQFICEKAGVM